MVARCLHLRSSASRILVPTCQTCKPIDGVTHNATCVFPEEDDDRRLSAGEAFTRALLSKRRLEEEEAAEPVDCGSEYACVQSDLAKNFAKGAKKAYEKIH